MEQKRSHSESVVFLFIKQVKAANDWESYFGLGYRKLSMESEGDIPGIGTLALIYWNHFFKAGPFLFHMEEYDPSASELLLMFQFISGRL